VKSDPFPCPQGNLAGILLETAAESAVRGDFFPIAAVICGKFPALVRQGTAQGILRSPQGVFLRLAGKRSSAAVIRELKQLLLSLSLLDAPLLRGMTG